MELEANKKRFQINYDYITLNVTNVCQMNCPNCAAICTKHQAPDPERTFEEPRRFEAFVDESLKTNREWTLIKLSGGEPTLHPELPRLIDIVRSYKEKRPETCVQLLTNGATGRFRRMKKAGFLSWLQIRDSSVKGKDAINMTYDTINMAPVDDPAFDGDEFDRGCYRAELGVSMHKGRYYACCGVLANIARILNLDIGLRALSDLTEENLRAQMMMLCRFCGSYKSSGVGARKQMTSPTWSRIFADYNAAGKERCKFAKLR